MANALDELNDRWSACQAQDVQKERLMKDLFDHAHDLSAKLQELESELRDKKDVNKILREKIENREKQLQELELAKARHTFILVVIDGDGMLFKDELVKQGQDGGMKAARLLKQAAEEDFRSSTSGAEVPQLQVVVRIFANVKGLAKTYADTDILSEATVLDDFIRGFNMSHGICDYVDAGIGKECSDEKVKANFVFNLPDTHCRHIIFGGSADNGYARLLGPYAEDPVARHRITLLEGPPFAYELARIKDNFRVVSFDDVFRAHKLVKRKVSFHITPPATPSVDYAKAAAKAPAVSLPATSTTASKGLASVKVLRNKFGQRVDPRLEYSQFDFINLKYRRLCNSFHILGSCPFEERKGSCQHVHGERLNPKQLQALRAVARQSPCQTGLSCSDLDCLAGHRCLRGDCVGEYCRFPPDMHRVDTKVVA